ncbi:hypothetical protein D9M68_972640 [compost metagenome]
MAPDNSASNDCRWRTSRNTRKPTTTPSARLAGTSHHQAAGTFTPVRGVISTNWYSGLLVGMR